MKGVCSRFDYEKEIQACINVLEEQIEQLMSDASNGDSNVLQKLQSYKETKESMKKLRDNVQKHLSQRV
jgi:L-lactate utilization protein LutB